MPDDDRGARLAALIDEAPDDADVYRAYGDWLEEQGDPRSQLMGMHILRERLTDRTKLDHLDERLTALFEQHREHFLGKLAKVMPGPTASRQRRDGAPKLEWRHGFIYRAELRRVSRMTMDRFLDHLLSHPSGRFLVHLSATWPEDAAAVAAVLAQRAPLSLRTLDLSAHGADLAPLWPVLPRLHVLDVSTPRAFGAIALPALRIARVRIAHPVQLRSLVEAHWPTLEELDFDAPADATPDEILAILRRDDLPQLHTLVLRLRDRLPAVMPAFAATPLAHQLATLVLHDLDAATIGALATLPRPLEVLRVPAWHVDEARARLAHVAKQIAAAD